MVTRRQHFVFRHYLDFWAEHRKVRALRAEKQFDTNPVNVAVGKDFYSINRLTQEDLFFFDKLMCSPPFSELAIKANRQWAERYLAVGEASHFACTSPQISNADKDAVEEVRIELFEKLHGAIEARAVSLLASVRDGDLGFLSRETEAIDFLCYITHQMFRTKRMRDQIVEPLSSQLPRENIQRLQSLIAFCMAETIAGNLYVDRNNYSVKILKTEGADEFITSDQPVINLLGSGNGTPAEHLVFYYPIGADRALMYFPNDLPFANVGEVLQGHEVHQLNQAIICNSHEFLFSSTQFDLLGLSKSIEATRFQVPEFVRELITS